jgi:hypothetical protein
LGLTEKGQSLCHAFQHEALSTILAELTARLSPEEARQLQHGTPMLLAGDEFGKVVLYQLSYSRNHQVIG